MAETKPTKVARWATDANRTLEPTAGEKDTGWQVGDKPPGRKMNWLQNIAYSWFNWLNERVFDGASAEDLEVTGVDIATGTDQEGGDLRLSGGSSTGDGGSEIEFQLAEANQGAGAAVRAPATAMKLKENGALNLTPRAADPVSGAKGDVYANSVDGERYVHNGTIWVPQIGKRFASVVASTSVTVVGVTQFDETYVIPADTLRIGSVIRIHAWVAQTGAAGGGNVIFHLFLGAAEVAVSINVAVNVNEDVILEATAIIRTIGAGGTLSSSGKAFTESSNVVEFRILESNAINTTIARTIAAQVTYSANNNAAQLEGLVVDIS